MDLYFHDRDGVNWLVKSHVRNEDVSKLIEEDLKKRHLHSNYIYFREYTIYRNVIWIDFGSTSGREFYILES